MSKTFGDVILKTQSGANGFWAIKIGKPPVDTGDPKAGGKAKQTFPIAEERDKYLRELKSRLRRNGKLLSNAW